MSYSRRKFIATSVLGVVGYSVANSRISTGYSVLFDPEAKKVTGASKSIIADKLREAAVLRRSGDLENAKTVYLEVIALDASEVRAYDGIRKILLHSKYKELEVLSLYNNGLTQFPDSKAFKERVAREYMRLSVGNKKKQDELNNPDSLLQTSKQFFEELKNLHPDDKTIDAQYQKALLLIEKNAESNDARQNELMKDYKRVNRLNFKARFSELSVAETKQKLDELLSKTENPYRDIHIRELYEVYIKKLKEAKDFDQAATISHNLYSFDQEDSHSLKLARRVCRKDKKYEDLEVIERNNEAIKQSFWAKVALFDCLYLRYRKEGVGSLSEMTSLVNAASFKKFSFYQNFEFKVRQIKLSMIKGEMTTALDQINQFADKLLGTSSAHFLNKFNLLCSKYYLKIENKQSALKVIDIALWEEVEQLTDPLLIKLIELNKDKEDNKPIHRERLMKYKAWLASK